MTPEQARQYWVEHASTRARPNFEHDPDALDNVCHPGLPPWLNAYYARHQARTYAQLLDMLPREPHATALDVGCGAGRWCRTLSDSGYRVTGIDLQAELIAENQRRYKNMTFMHTPLEDFRAPQSFDLVSSVTVLQHHPGITQSKLIRKLHTLVRSGGHAIILENIHDQGANVFANTPAQWVQKFHDAGFKLLRQQTYDHSPLLRTHSLLMRAVGSLAVRLGRPPAPRLRKLLRTPLLWESLMRVDNALEPALMRAPLPARLAVHCGFVFQAV